MDQDDGAKPQLAVTNRGIAHGGLRDPPDGLAVGKRELLGVLMNDVRNNDLPWRDNVRPEDVPLTVLLPAEDGGGDRLAPRCPWGWKARPSDVVEGSWRAQVVLFDVGAVRLRLQAVSSAPCYAGVAGDQCLTGTQGELRERPWPFTNEILVAGSVPGSVPMWWTEVAGRSRRLLDTVRSYYVASRAAVLLDRGHEWVEPGVIAYGLSVPPAQRQGIVGDWQGRFLQRCRANGITRVVRIDNGSWQVLDIDLSQADPIKVVSTDRCTLTRDVQRRCPMLAAPSPGERCKIVGGPYGSVAIHLAGSWRQHQAILSTAIGCDTCQGTGPTAGGTSISLLPAAGDDRIVNPIPTRWLTADERRAVKAPREPAPTAPTESASEKAGARIRKAKPRKF